MKKFALILAAALCCTLSCKKADNNSQKPEEKPDNTPAYVEFTMTFWGTDDLVKYADVKVTYNDGTGEKTETVTTANWVKTVKANLPASFTFERKVTLKPDVKMDDEQTYSYVNAHLAEYKIFTASGTQIKTGKAGGTGTTSNLKGSKISLVIEQGLLDASLTYTIDKDGKCPQTDAPA